MRSRIPALLLLAIAVLPLPTRAEDIDIFVGAAGSSGNPNILLILDNSSNWSAANQNWPTDSAPPVPCGNDCNKQGYYELKAIREVVGALPVNAGGDAEVNLGLMLFNNANATRDGGYMRSAVRPLTAANKAAFLNTINAIIQSFNTETGPSSGQYAALLFDAFKYFGGFTNPANVPAGTAPATLPAHDGVPVFGPAFWGSNDADGSRPDAAAYDGSNYVSPIDEAGNCAKNYIIFIGNGLPAKDDTQPRMNEILQKLLYPGAGTAVNQLPMPTITPTLGAFGAWADISACKSKNACESEQPENTLTDTLATQYQCVTTATCTGGNRMLQSRTAPVTGLTTTWSTPSVQMSGYYGDEYTDFLYRTDVSSAGEQQNVATYTIDVCKDQCDLNQAALMGSMARYGGGKSFKATNYQMIVDALRQILVEITAVNTTFASASLPVNATNRAQNENQVFIGMFRPDPDAKPRWFGNLKRYQLANFSGIVDLADSNGDQAVNPQTGFVTECAVSYWTTDSGAFWQNVTTNPPPISQCGLSAFSLISPYSDLPDGRQVEKGAVAEVLRKGNNPPATDTTPTWTENRTIYTLSGGTLTAFNTASSGLPSNTVDFTRGTDINDENANSSLTDVRASVHGDVIHSRPLPVNYSGDVTVYYGANDGTLRAVDAATGKEKWAFIAPESFPSLDRLRTNSPLVNYPGLPDGIVPAPTPKNYFFDGSIGVYQTADDSSVWIYPTMRRGGRMVYGMDVTNAATPSFKWRAGCDASDNCTTGFSNIGQTWSIPSVALVKGYSTTAPVVVMGGGYDTCEDADTVTPSCTSPKGANVYIMDADTGDLIKSFATTRSVAADIALIDMDFDGFVDYAYVADTGGNIYRIDLVTPGSPQVARAPADWTIRRVAYTAGAGRKFLFPPALLPSQGQVYLAIGSGDREHPLQSHYPFNGVTNRFYVVLDNPQSTVEVNLDDTSLMYDNTNPTICTSPKILPGGSMKGWFMDLNQYGQGEQTVTSALILTGLVSFSTNRPVPPAAGSCASVLGEARGYWVNLLNGSGAVGVTGSCGGVRSGIFIGGGLPPSPVTGTVPIGGKPQVVVIGAVQKEGTGASSPIGGQKVTPTISPKRKRIFWRSSGDN